jgi:Tfp pilus assembly protein PilF
LRFRGGHEQNRDSGSASFFLRRFPHWSGWPAWKRYALLAIFAVLGLATGIALMPNGRDSLNSHAPANKNASSPYDVHQPPASSPETAQTTSTPLSASEIDELQKNAKKAFDSGQFEEAATQYRKILEANPSSEDTHFGLAVALARQGRDDEAIQEYEEALRLMPNYAEVHNNLGNLLAKQGKLTEAMEHFQTALKITPGYASALNNMGTVLVRQGQFDQAREAFQKAVKASPDNAAAHYNLGASLMRVHNPEAAAREFEETLKLQPEFQQATNALALARKQSAADPQSSANSALGPTPP